MGRVARQGAPFFRGINEDTQALKPHCANRNISRTWKWGPQESQSIQIKILIPMTQLDGSDMSEPPQPDSSRLGQAASEQQVRGILEED